MVKFYSSALKKYPLILISGFIFYILFVALFSRDFADFDFWGYLSFGRVFWDEGFFPYQDVFSYTPTKPLWVYHEWLTGVVFFGLIKYLGPASLQLLRYIIAIVTVCLIYSTAIKRSNTLFFALILLIPSMFLISFGYFPVRAQVFTYFFFILTLYILETAKKSGDGKVLRWLPLIQVLWCNFHGGFVAGLGLIFLYALGEGLARKKMTAYYLLWGVIAFFATLINPYGIEYWIYTIKAIAMPRPEITEWYSVAKALKSNVQFFPVVLFLSMSILMLMSLLFRKKKDITELLVIAAMVCLGSLHIRHGVFLGLVFGAYMPVYFSEYAHAWDETRRYTTRLFSILLVIFTGGLIATYGYFFSVKQINVIPSFRFVVSSNIYPVNAINWLKTNNIKGNILPHFEWGEYLIWSCYPDYRVAMDGRYETVYQDAVHREYFDFLLGRDGGDIFLKKYPHDIVLLRAGTKTHALMIREKAWRMVYSDPISVVFIKINH